MSEAGFSEAEADAYRGQRVRSAGKNSIVPVGSQGRVIGKRKAEDGTYELVVEWQVNPAFVMRVPIQAAYPGSAIGSTFELVD